MWSSGLPAIVASVIGARQVTITDYPDSSLIDNIQKMVINNNVSSTSLVIPHIWGEKIDLLLQESIGENNRFDLILLAELLWKDTYDLQVDLLQSVSQCLFRKSGITLVAFTHRITEEHFESHDMEFFEKASQQLMLDGTVKSSFFVFSKYDAIMMEVVEIFA